YIINTQFLTYATVENFRTLLISIIPLNINWNEGAPFFAYNLLYPAWTITYEIGFYVFFGVSMSISHKYRTIICSVFIIMVVSFTQYYVNGNISFSGDVSAGLFTDNWLLGYTNVITSPMMYEFVIGMFLSEIFTNINESKSIKRILSKYSLQILWISCGISIILFIIQRPYGHGLNGFGTMAMILIASSLVYEYCNITPKIKIFNFLGEISYSLYLIHAVILALFFYYKADLAEIGITGGFSVFFSLVIISITASYPI
ncbi:TPA: acyltransferase, partial [Escherichia coli]|nr:acyltransferase [Escherichia coli]